MCSIESSGFDELQRHLKEIGEAAASLDGSIAQLNFNPADPKSVEAAISKMEAAVDARIGNSSNSTVRQMVVQVKERFAAAIQARAQQALQATSDAGSSGEDKPA